MYYIGYCTPIENTVEVERELHTYQYLLFICECCRSVGVTLEISIPEHLTSSYKMTHKYLERSLF